MSHLLDLLGQLNSTYLFLAYAGMFIHTAIQAQKARNKYKKYFCLLKFLNYNSLHLIADFVAIPVILIIFSGPEMAAIWPINNITATLTGWTAQSMLHSLFKIKTK